MTSYKSNSVKIGSAVLARELSKNRVTKKRKKGKKQKKTKKSRESDISPSCRDAPTGAIAVIFGVRGDIADIITHTKFYVDRFRGFGILTRPILPFSIGLAGRPYNRVRTTVLHCDYYGNFHPLQNRHPLTDRQKNCHMRSGRDSYSCAKFGAYPSSGGGLLGEWLKCNYN